MWRGSGGGSAVCGEALGRVSGSSSESGGGAGSSPESKEGSGSEESVFLSGIPSKPHPKVFRHIL